MVLVVTVLVIVIYNLNVEVILLVILIVIYNLNVEVILLVIVIDSQVIVLAIVIYNLYIVIEYKYSNTIIITIVIYYTEFGGISNSSTCLLIFKVIVIAI